VSAHPKVKFWIAMLAFGAVTVLSPYFLLAGLLPDRTREIYAWLSALVWLLYCAWMSRRQASQLSENSPPTRELRLDRERVPRAVWLVGGPPIVVAALLWRLVAHGSELPWQPSATGPLAELRWLPVLVIFWNGLAAQGVVFGLAAWHSMSRSHEFRRTLLLTSIANQWLLLVLSIAFAGGTFMRVPADLEEPVLVMAIGVCAPLLAWNTWRINRLYYANASIGKWVYLDFQDQAFMGQRGVNMASAWFWGMAAVVILEVVLVRWILPQMPV
jgi:hypothetical protein